MNYINKKLYYSIEKLKKEKNALILAHYYQLPEIQEIADFVGDSYGLSKVAKQSTADIIVFAGVKFMAETAKLLNPATIVLLPEPEAGCSLADSCPAQEFEKFVASYPNHIVISYMNCSVEVKALSDIICTSSNAIQIVESLSKLEKIIFAPDKNLGKYINKQTGRNMILWDGFCHVHNQLHIENVIKMKQKHPNAILMSHPECQGTILDISDFVGSTTQIIDFSHKSKHSEFIVATETGILYELQKKSPKKAFYIVPADESCNCNDCNFMKMITLEKIDKSLKNNYFEITIDKKIAKRANVPIERMIEIVG